MSESLNQIRRFLFVCKGEKNWPDMCPALTLIGLSKTSVTQLTSADVLKDSSGGGEPWQVVWSLDSRVHLQPVGQKSCGSLMIFDIQTSRCSEDMNKTYGPSDHRLEASWVSNEIWGLILILKKNHLSVRYLWCSVKYVWRLCSLTWVTKQDSFAVMTIKSETGLLKNVWSEWEGKWMGLSLPARNINRNIMWPVTRVFINW